MLELSDFQNLIFRHIWSIKLVLRAITTHLTHTFLHTVVIPTALQENEQDASAFVNALPANGTTSQNGTGVDRRLFNRKYHFQKRFPWLSRHYSEMECINNMKCDKTWKMAFLSLLVPIRDNACCPVFHSQLFLQWVVEEEACLHTAFLDHSFKFFLSTVESIPTILTFISCLNHKSTCHIAWGELWIQCNTYQNLASFVKKSNCAISHSEDQWQCCFLEFHAQKATQAWKWTDSVVCHVLDVLTTHNWPTSGQLRVTPFFQVFLFVIWRFATFSSTNSSTIIFKR